MLFIVMHHLAAHGGYNFTDVTAVNKAVWGVFLIGGKLGVNLFVLISGYFLIDSTFKIEKFLKLIAEVFFYSAIIYLIFLLSGKIYFDSKIFVRNFLPTLTNRYWFVSCYVIMYALSPFINKALNACKMSEHAILIAILLFIHCILTYFKYSYLSNANWFIALYIVAAFVKRYKNKLLDNRFLNLAVFVVSYALIAVHVIVYDYRRAYYLTSLLCFIASLSLFNVFRLIKKPFSSKLINCISASTLGVYLIHDNNYIRGFLWRELLNCPQAIKHDWFPLFAVIAVLAVFIVCTLIDILRRYLIEKPVFFLCKKGYLSIKNKRDRRLNLTNRDVA